MGLNRFTYSEQNNFFAFASEQKSIFVNKNLIKA